MVCVFLYDKKSQDSLAVANNFHRYIELYVR